MKEIESVIKSQHWEAFGAIAENMKNLTKSINTKRYSPIVTQQQIGFEDLLNSNNSSLDSNSFFANQKQQELEQVLVQEEQHNDNASASAPAQDN